MRCKMNSIRIVKRETIHISRARHISQTYVCIEWFVVYVERRYEMQTKRKNENDEKRFKMTENRSTTRNTCGVGV